jgi:hypothetical protein
VRAGIGGDEGTAKKEKSHCGDWLRGTAFRAHGGLPLHRESGARGTSRDCASRNGSPSSRGLLRSLSYPCGRSTGKMVPFRGSRERICARTHARAGVMAELLGGLHPAGRYPCNGISCHARTAGITLRALLIGRGKGTACNIAVSVRDCPEGTAKGRIAGLPSRPVEGLPGTAP